MIDLMDEIEYLLSAYQEYSDLLSLANLHKTDLSETGMIGVLLDKARVEIIEKMKETI